MMGESHWVSLTASAIRRAGATGDATKALDLEDSDRTANAMFNTTMFPFALA